MSIPNRSLSCFLPILLLQFLLVAPINGLEPRKLDETGLPGSADPSIKCGGCSPCGSAQCYLSPPPPPPVPSPPPPSPPKKPPSTGYNCPPPPSAPGFIYITGPPGNLYPVDQSYSGSARISAALFGSGLLGLLMLWL